MQTPPVNRFLMLKGYANSIDAAADLEDGIEGSYIATGGTNQPWVRLRIVHGDMPEVETTITETTREEYTDYTTAKARYDYVKPLATTTVIAMTSEGTFVVFWF